MIFLMLPDIKEIYCLSYVCHS